VRCIGVRFVSYPKLSLHFRQHASNVTVPRAALSNRFRCTSRSRPPGRSTEKDSGAFSERAGYGRVTRNAFARAPFTS
jgi:hypothetical protein